MTKPVLQPIWNFRNGARNPINRKLNTVILSLPRSGSTKLGEWFNQNDFVYYGETYTEFDNNYHYKHSGIDYNNTEDFRSFSPDRKFDNFLAARMRATPAPVCIKVQLQQLYNYHERTMIADRLFLRNSFPNCIYIYRKNAHELVTSLLLARNKNAYSNYYAVTNPNYYEPVTIELKDYIIAAKHAYRYWSELLHFPVFTGSNEMWVTYEDDILPLEFPNPDTVIKPMPDKNNIITNIPELQAYYNENLAKSFEELEIEYMRRREDSKQKWQAFLLSTAKYREMFNEIEKHFTES